MLLRARSERWVIGECARILSDHGVLRVRLTRRWWTLV